jgi:hypothetical protein
LKSNKECKRKAEHAAQFTELMRPTRKRSVSGQANVQLMRVMIIT